MSDYDDHVNILDKKITELRTALAHVGQGTDLQELIRIISRPGYTTPAEFAFSIAMIDSMQIHVKALNTLNTQLLAASKLVTTKENPE